MWKTIARCASIEAKQIVLTTHAPMIASVGLPFAIAELADLDTLGKACPNTAAFAEAGRRYSPDDDQFALFVYVRQPDNPWALRARMFRAARQCHRRPGNRQRLRCARCIIDFAVCRRAAPISKSPSNRALRWDAAA